MLILAAATILIAAAQILCTRAARRRHDRLMRPADELSPDDIDRWLDLIVTFELPEGPERVL